MSQGRLYSTRRASIIGSIVDLVKNINGTDNYASNLYGNVYPKLKYLNDINDFPAVCVVAGSEDRQYQAGHYRDRYLNVKVLIFVNEENPLTRLDCILEDIETLIEDNGNLEYFDRHNNSLRVKDISVLSITTDEGTLEPIAIGDMALRVHY